LDGAGSEPVADGLQCGGVVAGGEAVGQFPEADTGLEGLAFGPLVPAMPISALRAVCRAAGYAAPG
jgi:hypothetical protein